MLPAIAVLGGTLVVGGFPFILGEGGSTGSTPSPKPEVVEPPVERQPKPEVVETPVEQVQTPVKTPIEPEVVEQPVETPVEQPVEQPVETQPKPEVVEQLVKTQPKLEEVKDTATAPSLPEIESMAGGQRGGYGRPTWAPLNSGTTLFQAIGVQPGSTSGNILANVTGTKTPQQIQQELVVTEQQIRAITTQQFKTNETYTEELNKFNGTTGTTGIRQDYLELVGQVSYWKFIEKLSSDKLNSFNGVSNPVPTTISTNLKLEFDKEFKKSEQVGDPPTKKTFEQWLKDSINVIKSRKKEKSKNFRGEKPPDNESEYIKWYTTTLASKITATTPTSTTTRMSESDYKKVLKEEIDASKNKEDFMFKESMKKTEYDESVAKLTELRSKRSELSTKLKELNETKRLLLEELSSYKVPQSFFDKTKRPETPRSVVPTGEELNKLLIEYKQKQEEIKQKQEEIDEEVELQLENGKLKDKTNYNKLTQEKKDLEEQRQNIINKIEGRSTDQTKQIRALNELDIFIKQLKEQKVKAVTLFDNPDFRKVFDMLTLMSLDSDAKSFVVNLDKYSNFFVTTKGFSAYNGEVLDKVFYFLKNFTQLISSPDSQKLIINFGSKFGSNVGQVDDNINIAKTFLETSGNTTTEEFKKLDDTQRRILEGRSTAWHTFFTDSDRLKAIPRAFSSVLFKTELDKLVKLESVIKRRILDKIDKTKFETASTGESWYTKYIPDVLAWFKSKPADRKQFLLAFCKKFKEENIQKIEGFDKEFEKYEKLITEKATKGINGSLLTMSDAISELEKIIPKLEKERDRRLDPKLKRRIQADIDDYTQRKTSLETNLNHYKIERSYSMQLKELNKDLIAKLELLKDDENCLKNAETLLKDIRLLNRCDGIFQRILAEQKDILKDLPKLEQYLRSALRQQGDYSPAEIEDCIKRKLNEQEHPLPPAVLSVDSFDKTGVTVSWTGGSSLKNTLILTDKVLGISERAVTTSNPFTFKRSLADDTEFNVQLESELGTQKVTSNIVDFKTSKTAMNPIIAKLDDVTQNTITVSWTGGDGATITSEINGVANLAPITSPHTFTGLTSETDYSIVIIATNGTDVVRSNTLVTKTPRKISLKDVLKILFAEKIAKDKYKPTFDSADSFLSFLITIVTTKLKEKKEIPDIFPATIDSYIKGVKFYRDVLNPSLFNPKYQYIATSISGKYNPLLNDVFRNDNVSSTDSSDQTQQIIDNYNNPVCKFKTDDDVRIVSITSLVKDTASGKFVEKKKLLTTSLFGKIIEDVFYSRDNHTSAIELCTGGNEPFYKVKYTDESGSVVTGFLSESDLILKSSPPPPPPPAGSGPIKMEGSNPKVEGPFVGGSNADIQEKLKALYDTPDPNPDNKKLGAWNADETDSKNEFFYIMTVDDSKIVGAVRISNSDSGPYPLELGMDFIDPTYQGQKLERPLLKARLKHVIEEKSKMYVAYTEFDKLRDIHIELGMTQTPSTKVTVNGKDYWRLEYNRDPRTLVVTTGFPTHGVCSGIAIGNDGEKEFIYTATHCLLIPKEDGTTEGTLPNSVSHPLLTTPTDFFRKNGNIVWDNPVKTRPPYTEEVDDVAVLNTTLLLDTTNVFFIDNVEDIPEEYDMKKWGLGSWADTKIDTDTNAQNYIRDPAFPARDLDANYPGWRSNVGKYFRVITQVLRGGNSGGPHGVFFNRKTGVVGQDEKCYAIIGTTTSQKIITTAYRHIPWLTGLGIKVNIAHYNANGTITIVQAGAPSPPPSPPGTPPGLPPPPGTPPGLPPPPPPLPTAGGNHTTRKQRVRGIFKNSKTRRTY